MPAILDDLQSSSRKTGQAGRELEIQGKLGHEISFPTGTLLHGVKRSSCVFVRVCQCRVFCCGQEISVTFLAII